MTLEGLSDLEILALTLFGEARGESIESIVACGCVARNRVHSGLYKNYRHACLAPFQFSCWNEDDPNYPVLLELAEKMFSGNSIMDLYFKQCMWVAHGIIDWDIIDNTKSAMNYMTTSLFNSDKKPKWAKGIDHGVEKGNHIFFTA